MIIKAPFSLSFDTWGSCFWLWKYKLLLDRADFIHVHIVKRLRLDWLWWRLDWLQYSEVLPKTWLRLTYPVSILIGSGIGRDRISCHFCLAEHIIVTMSVTCVVIFRSFCFLVFRTVHFIIVKLLFFVCFGCLVAWRQTFKIFPNFRVSYPEY